jgi:acid phosphatase
MNRTALALLLTLTAVPVFAQGLPHPKHIVLVIMENKAYEDVIDNDPATPVRSSRAPYLNRLAREGALLTHSYGLHHPSQPNYLELFSGSTHGICNDHPPRAFSIDAANLAMSLGMGFVGFAENLPTDLTTPKQGVVYVRRHCAWLAFSGITADQSSDFSTFPKTAEGFTTLPAVAIVIPNLYDDMHTTRRFIRHFDRHDIAAEVHQGDKWLEDHLGAYATWAMTNNSLLIVTC